MYVEDVLKSDIGNDHLCKSKTEQLEFFLKNQTGKIINSTENVNVYCAVVTLSKNEVKRKVL